jgi:hypothetical protein
MGGFGLKACFVSCKKLFGKYYAITDYPRLKSEMVD